MSIKPAAAQGSVITASNAGLTAITFVDNTPGTIDYKDVVVAFRGTVASHDLFVSDAQLAVGIKPTEFDAAVNFVVQNVETVYPSSQGYSFFVTGHSLGGAEAENVAAVLGFGGDTFAAPGVGNILSDGGVLRNGANLIDYVIADDPVGNHTILSGEHVGTVVTLPDVHFTSTPFRINPLAPSQTALGFLIDLREHPIFNYGEALSNAGLIKTNPLPLNDPSSSGSTSRANLTEAQTAQIAIQRAFVSAVDGAGGRLPDAFHFLPDLGTRNIANVDAHPEIVELSRAGSSGLTAMLADAANTTLSHEAATGVTVLDQVVPHDMHAQHFQLV